MPKRVLITGGAGFAASAVIQRILDDTDWDIVVMDKLTYASNGLTRLRDCGFLDHPRIQVLHTDIATEIPEGVAQEAGDINIIIHMAASTHVDYSIARPWEFVVNNIHGTYWILEYARKLKNLELFEFFSTDESMGNLDFDAPTHVEGDAHAPRNPYAATKAAGEDMVMAWGNTYRIPYIITRTMNLAGPSQGGSKFIPLCIRKILRGEEIQIHATPDCKRAGTRFYIHIDDMAAALLYVIQHGKKGEIYHIVGDREVGNDELALMIGKILGKDVNYRLVDFHSGRWGHDTRYGLNGNKLLELGFVYPSTFEQSLTSIVHWYLEHPEWLDER